MTTHRGPLTSKHSLSVSRGGWEGEGGVVLKNPSTGNVVEKNARPLREFSEESIVTFSRKTYFHLGQSCPSHEIGSVQSLF